ncbi:MAG: hypothetical protein MJ066_02400 [Clostridia bacterium]|nr:hypothetical protein [Clostridia bacterium]
MIKTRKSIFVAVLCFIMLLCIGLAFGGIYNSEKVSAATCNHSYDDGVIITAPTIDAQGTIMYKCTKCGKVKIGALPQKEEYVIDEEDAYMYFGTVGGIDSDVKMQLNNITSSRINSALKEEKIAYNYNNVIGKNDYVERVLNVSFYKQVGNKKQVIENADVIKGEIVKLKIALPIGLSEQNAEIIVYGEFNGKLSVKKIALGDEVKLDTTYTVDEQGYMHLEVSSFKEVALVYKEECDLHLGIFIVVGMFVVLSIINFIVRIGKKKFGILGIVAGGMFFISDVAIGLVGYFINGCLTCATYAVGGLGVLLVVEILNILLGIGKNKNK